MTRPLPPALADVVRRLYATGRAGLAERLPVEGFDVNFGVLVGDLRKARPCAVGAADYERREGDAWVECSASEDGRVRAHVAVLGLLAASHPGNASAAERLLAEAVEYGARCPVNDVAVAVVNHAARLGWTDDEIVAEPARAVREAAYVMS